jgi:galactokinase
MPAGWLFAVGVSGVVADKGGAVQDHYNRLSDQAAAAARAWVAGRPGGAPEPVEEPAPEPVQEAAPLNLGRALGVDPEAEVLDAVRRGAAALGDDVDPDALVQRTRHFLAETGLVDTAFEALEAGDLVGFSDAANRSARVGAELLENQVPETLALTALAREIGAPAASPFGAGFGGAVWALVREADAEAFLADWRNRYTDAFPARTGARFLATPPSSPAETV